MTEKETYLAPAIRVMAFKAERGYATSTLSIGQTGSYNTSGNSGSVFWGADAQMELDYNESVSGNDSYNNWEFGW